jgi:hypothetical protein
MDVLAEEHVLRPRRKLTEYDLEIVDYVQQTVQPRAEAIGSMMKLLRSEPPSELWRLYKGKSVSPSGSSNLGRFAELVDRLEALGTCAGEAMRGLLKHTKKANASGMALPYLFGTKGLGWEKIGYEPEGFVTYAVSGAVGVAPRVSGCELTDAVSFYGAWWSLYRLLAKLQSEMILGLHEVDVRVRVLTKDEWYRWKHSEKARANVRENIRRQLERSGEVWEIHSPDGDILDTVDAAAIMALPPPTRKTGRAAVLAAKGGTLPRPWRRGVGVFRATRGQPELEPSEPYIGKRTIAGREYAEPLLGSRHPLAPTYRPTGRAITKRELQALKRAIEEKKKAKATANPSAPSLDERVASQWFWDVMP